MADLPPNSQHFMTAARYAVVGRTLENPDKFDNEVLVWYKDRKLPVLCVRPPSDRFDNSKPVEGVKVYDDVTQLPDLANTSISFIISPRLGIQMMESLFPSPRDESKEPRAVWFQPGAESDEIWQFVKARGIQNKVVIGDHACVLVSGDEARKPVKAGL